jgi:hypothetical protein
MEWKNTHDNAITGDVSALFLRIRGVGVEEPGTTRPRGGSVWEKVAILCCLEEGLEEDVPPSELLDGAAFNPKCSWRAGVLDVFRQMLYWSLP